MNIKLGIIIAIGLALAYFLFLRGGGDITGSQARQLVDDGALLVDVRTTEEFAAGHIPGAVNIPVQSLEQRLDELGPTTRPVVVYCRSGRRSADAARTLTGAGYSVHDLGAMSRW
jgi:phage shock protein E